MKKFFALFLAFSLVISTGLVGCGGAVDNSVKKEKPAERPPQDDNKKDEKFSDSPGEKQEGSFAGGKGGTINAPQ